jgi:hypothetical protein
MRACDLYWEIEHLRASAAGDTIKRPVTLRQLNRIKNQRKRREREEAAKAPLIARMYGDWERQMLDDLSQQIQGLDAAGAAPDDIDAANRALRQISRRVR